MTLKEAPSASSTAGGGAKGRPGHSASTALRSAPNAAALLQRPQPVLARCWEEQRGVPRPRQWWARASASTHLPFLVTATPCTPEEWPSRTRITSPVSAPSSGQPAERAPVQASLLTRLFLAPHCSVFSVPSRAVVRPASPFPPVWLRATPLHIAQAQPQALHSTAQQTPQHHPSSEGLPAPRPRPCSPRLKAMAVPSALAVTTLSCAGDSATCVTHEVWPWAGDRGCKRQVHASACAAGCWRGS